MPLVLIGIHLARSHQSKTKDHVDVVGLLQLLDFMSHFCWYRVPPAMIYHKNTFYNVQHPILKIF
jgi:hypothetical protein